MRACLGYRQFSSASKAEGMTRQLPSRELDPDNAGREGTEGPTTPDDSTLPDGNAAREDGTGPEDGGTRRGSASLYWPA
jgi:hypothetical protein